MITNKSIDGGKPFDWGFTSEEYAKFRDIYPSEMYDRLREFGVAKTGSAWLDLGCGTGILPQNLYNKNADITGVDISEEQIEFARQAAEKAEQSIRYFVSPAESTGMPDNSLDCITAAQCFWYFDRKKMKSEIKRMLRHGGKLIKLFLDWAPDDELAEKSIKLVQKYNPSWSPYCYGVEDINDDLFEGRHTEISECYIPFTRESWHGRMCACRGTLASMSKEQFEAWNKEHLRMLSESPEEFTVKHILYITWFEL